MHNNHKVVKVVETIVKISNSPEKLQGASDIIHNSTAELMSSVSILKTEIYLLNYKFI